MAPDGCGMNRPALQSRIRAAIAADDEYQAARKAEKRKLGDRATKLQKLQLRNACVDDLCGPEMRSRLRFLRELLGEAANG
jgi:hypothetical protein